MGKEKLSLDFSKWEKLFLPFPILPHHLIENYVGSYLEIKSHLDPTGSLQTEGLNYKDFNGEPLLFHWHLSRRGEISQLSAFVIDGFSDYEIEIYGKSDLNKIDFLIIPQSKKTGMLNGTEINFVFDRSSGQLIRHRTEGLSQGKEKIKMLYRCWNWLSGSLKVIEYGREQIKQDQKTKRHLQEPNQ